MEEEKRKNLIKRNKMPNKKTPKCDGSKPDCDCDLHPQKRMRQYN